MNRQLGEFAALLEEEILVGEQLRDTLVKHRHALAVWDVNALVASIEVRQAGVRRLAELEARRHRIIESVQKFGTPVRLRMIIQTAPVQASSKEYLRVLRSRAQEVFVRLQAEERDLNEVMTAFRSHFVHALQLLKTPSAAGYSGRGANSTERTISALMCHKA
jgi:hypothetical protein